MIHNPRGPRARRIVTRSLPAAGLALALALGLAACSGDGEAAAPPVASSAASSAAPSAASPAAPSDDPDGVTTIQPGAPGEPATTGSVAPVQPAGWNDADAAFVQMMVPHHVQALQMAELARQHAVDPQVRRLAARIAAAQGPEVATMGSWLAEQGLEPAGVEGMDAMAAMHGMLSGEEMQALSEARGADFDRLFLEGMVRHHQGAIDMADDVAVEGADVRVAELAADVTLTQTAEIERMREIGSLPTP